MKHHIRTLTCGVALLAAIIATGCGGKQTMASKSAAAFDEAKRKGIPIAAGEHGGHSTGQPAAATDTTHAEMPGMDHGAMPGMDHSQMTTTDHAPMSGMDHSAMAGLDHSKMPGMQHSAAGAAAHDMPGMDHSAMAGMDHSKTAGMRHGAATAARLIIAAPTTNAAMAQTQPAATLKADDFDAPAPTAIDEAKKAAQPPSEHHHENGAAS